MLFIYFLQNRDPDLEGGDDLEATDREYCQVNSPSLIINNFLLHFDVFILHFLKY